MGEGADCVAAVPCEELGVSRVIVARSRRPPGGAWRSLRRRFARARRPSWAGEIEGDALGANVPVAFVPEGALGFHERPGAVPAAICGPSEIELRAGETVSFEIRSFRVTVAVSPSEQAPWSGRARFRGVAVPGACAAVAAAAHAAVLLVASQSANAAAFEPDPDVDTMSRYLAAAEARSAAAETPVQGHEGTGQARFVDGKNGNGKESGGARAAGSQGSMGSATRHQGDAGRFAVSGASSSGAAVSRAEAFADARSFGMAGLLASESARAPVSSFGEVAAKGIDAIGAMGNLWASSIGDTYGSGGLGLSGVGEGGGGQFLGIGLGSSGIGHGDGGGLYTGGFGGGSFRSRSWAWRGEWGPYTTGPVCGYGGGYGRNCRQRRPAPISVQIGAASVRALRPGAVADSDVIQRVIAGARSSFLGCYSPVVSWDPVRGEGLAPNGTVVTNLVIDSDGRVVTAGTGSSTFAGPYIGNCVRNVLGRLSYGAQTGAVGVQIPVGFRFAGPAPTKE